MPAAIQRAGWSRQQRLDDRPQSVRHEIVNQGHHDAESCQITPKELNDVSAYCLKFACNPSGSHGVLPDAAVVSIYAVVRSAKLGPWREDQQAGWPGAAVGCIRYGPAGEQGGEGCAAATATTSGVAGAP
jgi:hypothetical protein